MNTMKKNSLNIFNTMLGLAILFSVGCTDPLNSWDEHYYQSSTEKSDLNLYEYIKSQENLSIFTQMLEISGYNEILSKSQTYTVWAPDNSVLNNVDLTDTESVTLIVSNHLTRFLHPTSRLSSEVVYMLDKKFITFKRTETGFSFGNIPLLANQTNLATSNGIVHVISGYVPYLRNLWEFIGYAEGIDSFRTFMQSQSLLEFDAENSVEIGTNEFGQAIYDSVIIFSNPILDQIGKLHMEDSIYSILVPNNKAWTDAYEKVKASYITRLVDGGAAKQRNYSQTALVQNLVFNQLITEPDSHDSLVTTTGSIFKSPGYLFSNTNSYTLSNGIAYVTDSLRYNAAESWQKPIQLEAENSNYGRSYKFANLFVRSSLGSPYESEISDAKYLLIESSSVSSTSMASVKFPIPNTLSGKYKIYCVFAPSTIIPTNKALPNKVKFYVSYMKSNETMVEDAPIDSKNAILLPTKIGAIFTTSADTISKMFVTQYDFPFCNILEKGDPYTDITFKLTVENAVKITETTKFSREMRIDYIILEPVQ